MSYGQFKTYEEVATHFKIKLIETSFIHPSTIKIPQGLFDFINDNLRLKRSYGLPT